MYSGSINCYDGKRSGGKYKVIDKVLTVHDFIIRVEIRNYSNSRQPGICKCAVLTQKRAVLIEKRSR